MRLAEFALASALIEMTPGPNMSYLAALALARGTRTGLKAVAGVATGLLLVGLLAAFGVASFLRAHPALDRLLRWGGILFMLWLAAESWREAGEGGEQSAGEAAAESAGNGSFWRGLTTNLLNPKLFLFYIAVLPDFLDQRRGDALAANLTLVAVYAAISTSIHVVLVLFAGRIGQFVGGTAKSRTLGRVMAAMLAGVAVWLLFELRR